MTMVGSIVQTNPVDYVNKWSRLCGQLSTMPLNRVNGLVLVIHGAIYGQNLFYGHRADCHSGIQLVM